MKVKLIVAMDENNAIGKDNDLLWQRDLPADLKRFKDLTIGHPVIMGRKTFESIVRNLGRPLPKRTSLVITRQKDYKAPDGVIVCCSLIEAVATARHYDPNEAFIIGGGEIYRLAMPIADEIYLTKVFHVFGGDVFFPEIDWSQWRVLETEEHPADDKNRYRFNFSRIERVES